MRCPRVHPNRPTPTVPRHKPKESRPGPSTCDSNCGCRQLEIPNPVPHIADDRVHAATRHRRECPLPDDSTTRVDSVPDGHPSRSYGRYGGAALPDLLHFPFPESPYILLNYHLRSYSVRCRWRRPRSKHADLVLKFVD